jgi:hypothetical protein
MDKGLHIIHHWQGNLPLAILESPFPITICKYWMNSNSAPTTYNFSEIVSNINQCLAHGKTFGIKIACGTKSPSFLSSHSVTVLSGTEFTGNSMTLTTFSQPDFTQTTYKNYFKAYITALAAAIAAIPGATAAFTHFTLTGINRSTEEYRICSQSLFQRVVSGPITSDWKSLWTAEGVTTSTIKAATQDLFDFIAAAFPTQELEFAMINYTGFRPFPNFIDGSRDLNVEMMDYVKSASYASRVRPMYTAVDLNFNGNSITDYAKSIGLVPWLQLSETLLGQSNTSASDLDQALGLCFMYGINLVEIHSDSYTAQNAATFAKWNDALQNNTPTASSSVTAARRFFTYTDDDINSYSQHFNCCLGKLGTFLSRADKKGSSAKKLAYQQMEFVLENILAALDCYSPLSSTNILTDTEIEKLIESGKSICSCCSNDYFLQTDIPV